MYLLLLKAAPIRHDLFWLGGPHRGYSRGGLSSSVGPLRNSFIVYLHLCRWDWRTFSDNYTRGLLSLDNHLTTKRPCKRCTEHSQANLTPQTHSLALWDVID